MNIAIAGCGITGTAVACLLAKSGHHVTIFEQAPVCQPLGAGIMLQPSGQSVLNELGLLQNVERESARLAGMTARLTSGRQLIQLLYSNLNPDWFALGVHRGRLFDELLQGCKASGVSLRNGCCVNKFNTDNNGKGIQVEFENNGSSKSEGSFDFLIGADGIRSKVRQQMESRNQLKTKFIEYDHAALWMTNRSDYQSDHLFQTVEGTKKLIGLLPIGKNECSFFWGLKANQYESLRQSDFEKWKAEVINDCPGAEFLLANKTSFDEFTFGKYGHVKVSQPAGEKVILLGDAAHATSPHLGQGANLGLEDAFLFARSLEESEDFEKACNQYCRIRKSKIRYYQGVTRILSPFFQSNSWLLGKIRDTFLPWFPHIPYVRTQMLRTLCGIKEGWFK